MPQLEEMSLLSESIIIKTLVIGSMWYQDVWNLNIDRLQRCVIHCPTFEGIVPFCSYAGLGYGEKIQKKYSLTIGEWEKKSGRSLKMIFKRLVFSVKLPKCCKIGLRACILFRKFYL